MTYIPIGVGEKACGMALAWVVAWAIATAFGGVTGALVSDGAPSGLHPTGFDPTIAGEQP